MGIFFRDKPQRPHQGGKRYGGNVRHSGTEETIQSEKITVEHKMFYFLLKENQRGRYLRITEESNGKSDTIIIPSTGIEDFRNTLNSLLDTLAQRAPEAPQETNTPQEPSEESV